MVCVRVEHRKVYRLMEEKKGVRTESQQWRRWGKQGEALGETRGGAGENDAGYTAGGASASAVRAHACVRSTCMRARTHTLGITAATWRASRRVMTVGA